MAIKDYTKELLRRLQDGTEAIRARYAEKTLALKGEKKERERELDEAYRQKVNEAAASSRIALQSELEQMADSGYGQTGETVQARMAENARLNRSLSSLSSDHAKGKRSLDAEYADATRSLEEGEAKELSSLSSDVQDALAQAEKAQLDAEEKEKDRLHEKELAQLKTSTAKTEDGITPGKSAYDYVEDIVKSETRYVPSKGYKEVDRKAILQKLTGLIRDESLSVRYRYEMYLYGKSLGYLS